MQILAQAECSHELSVFAENLPYRPYCTDDLAHGIYVQPLQSALKKRYLQYNPPASINWLVFDIDRVYLGHEMEWRMVAPPNIVARNPANGHAHLFYGIAAPVSKTSASRSAPLRLLAAINESYRHALGADVGFVELICKNPLNAFWDVETPRAELYDLGELAEWVDLDASDRRVRATPKRAQVGLGRNCNLFNSLRTWAYKWLKEYHSGSIDRWIDAVRQKADRLNTFTDPLPASEVKATAKSVARWVWTHYNGRATEATRLAEGLTPEAFSLLQSNLGTMGNLKKWGCNKEKQAEAFKLQASGMKQKEIAAALKVSQQSVSRWLKVHS